MDGDNTDESAPLRITREALASGALLREARRRAPPGTVFLSDAELAASLDRVLAAHDPGQDVWVFAYGSLIWNPALVFEERLPLLVHGWHRRFCLSLAMGRGTPDRPGLMLALDRGGACRGVAFRVAAAAARSELALLWRREMFTGAYEARWLTGRNGACRLRALAFVANRRHPRYAGTLPEAEVVRRIATARGHLGSCRAYLENTVRSLEAFRIRDPALEHLLREVSVFPSAGTD